MSKNKDCRIIGHRGAAGIYFENTLKGIQTAIDLGVECIEIDVWKTTDGEIVVFHDAYLDRNLKASPFAIITNFPNLFLNGTMGG